MLCSRCSADEGRSVRGRRFTEDIRRGDVEVIIGCHRCGAPVRASLTEALRRKVELLERFGLAGRRVPILEPPVRLRRVGDEPRVRAP